MTKAKLPLVIAGAVIALIVVFFIGRSTGDSTSTAQAAPAATSSEPTIWTCSMDPQIQQPEPGECPICGMDLIPLKTSSDSTLGERELKLSAGARKLAQIQVTPVERKMVEREVRMVGTVTYDETRVAAITAWVGGRLDRLYVDYTGIPVNQGDHMVWMYSPDILAAQEELIQSLKTVQKMQDSASDIVRQSVASTLEATRDKLRLWGLNQEQIDEIEKRGSATDHIQINAPIGGVVVQKNALEGDYVKTGTPIYRIADLSQVWVKLDAYETDLSWLHYGQEVEFESEAYPGQIFKGRIAFIDPVLTDKTRTIKVRVNVPNTNGNLKPGMFVRAVVRAQLVADGKVMDHSLAGKWIGPMHPEIIRDEPGNCPICGMPLKKAEELGYVGAEDAAGEMPLVIPASAPLITGTRAVVYVQNAKDPSRFEGNVIVLGPRAGDYYLVESGLNEGDLVVTNGAFKIDSALQIQAKPSMMSPPAQEAPMDMAAGMQVRPLLDDYLQIQQALANDKVDEAKAAAQALVTALAKVNMTPFKGDAHMAWMDAKEALERAATGIIKAKDIEWARGKFDRLSAAMIDLAERAGTGMEKEVLIMHCPMAFDNTGADWLQVDPKLANPYFGEMMSSCGEITKRLPAMKGMKAASAQSQMEGSHHE